MRSCHFAKHGAAFLAVFFFLSLVVPISPVLGDGGPLPILGHSPSVDPPTTLPHTSSSWPSDQVAPKAQDAVPPKVYEVLAEIQKRRGASPPGYIGGRVFENREQRLPKGRYREYDVNPRIPGRNRGAERLVIERRTGKAYYTRDHYRTFTLLN